MKKVKKALPVVRVEWARPYIESNLQLFPINKPTIDPHYFDNLKTKNLAAEIKKKHTESKAPKDAGWQSIQYSNEQLIQAIRDGYNLAWVVPKNVLIIDADPRNYQRGKDSLNELSLYYSVDFISNYPCVKTGGRGYHVYVSIPESLKVPKKLIGYPGIDFISRGHNVLPRFFVLIAGCLHPSGLHYGWHTEMPLDDIPMAPKALIDDIALLTGTEQRYPSNDVVITNYDQLMVSQLLDVLPILQYRDQHDWFTIMCAVHHATYGNDQGLALFLAWSLTDPLYAAQSEIIAKRWHSLSMEKSNAITINTLISHARQIDDQVTENIIGSISNAQLTPQTQSILNRYTKNPIINNHIFLETEFNGNLVRTKKATYHFDLKNKEWKATEWEEIEARYQCELESVGITVSVLDQGLRSLKRSRYFKELKDPCIIHKKGMRFEVKEFQSDTVVLKDCIFIPRNFLKNQEYFFPISENVFTCSPGSYVYDSKAECPNWHEFLTDIWDDASLITQLQQYFGYCLLDKNIYQKIGVFIGATRGGKSVITSILSDMINEASVAALSTDEMDRQFGFEVILGKKLIVLAEAESVDRRSSGGIVDKLKKISGGDKMSVTQKWKTVAPINCSQNILIVCNLFASLTDASGALTARLLFFPFTESFAGREDAGLQSRLMTELPGIFNWALEGLRTLLKAGRFVESASSAREKVMIMDKLQPLNEFCDEMCDFDESYSVRAKDLYDSYTSWCASNNYKFAKNKNNFLHELKSANPKVNLNVVKRVDGRPVRVVEGLSVVHRAGFN